MQKTWLGLLTIHWNNAGTITWYPGYHGNAQWRVTKSAYVFFKSHYIMCMRVLNMLFDTVIKEYWCSGIRHWNIRERSLFMETRGRRNQGGGAKIWVGVVRYLAISSGPRNFWSAHWVGRKIFPCKMFFSSTPPPRAPGNKKWLEQS